MKNTYNQSVKILFALLLVFMLLFSSCHTSGRGSSARRGSHYNEQQLEHLHVSGNKRGKKIVKEALEWEGTPYKYAGTEKGKGSDCSGMVMTVYQVVTGIKLPRNSAMQAEYCKPIKADEVEIGDLCFFATGKDPDKISHVGIMIDEERFIHASTSKGVVISKITTPYYTRTFMGFGRVPSE